MKIKNIISFLTKPQKFIENKSKIYADKHLRKMGFQHILEFNPDKDIFLVAYPKSGLTWLQNLIAGIQFGIHTEFLSDFLLKDLIPDVYMYNYYKRYDNFVFFKSHELPREDYKKVIYLVRDGRDAMVSYYHYNKNMGINTSMEEMIIEEKNIFPSSWWQHVELWKQNPYNAEILYIKYEDLLEDTYYVLSEIMKFANFKRDRSLVDKIIYGASFDIMQQKTIKYGGMAHKDWRGEKALLFFRKGKKEAYKEEMPLELIRYFTKKAKKQLEIYNYDTQILKND